MVFQWFVSVTDAGVYRLFSAAEPDASAGKFSDMFANVFSDRFSDGFSDGFSDAVTDGFS
jgi:hypothetical protein